ncbi:E3 ubiquitin-protein ligase RNF169 isoform X2 [Chiloscyllium plagiosum]|uniref:E3 ubiquitin-protein ligase RNF169 isoform X2 n=1 Tax=Chiloscyllium plagiosum TaxID=36176 RepID=UPI001CB863F7|nr:E3 ubiquitin-protein ligase RNF169 isoform X2 [Chiloscyllium plagiosum]
MKDVGLVRSWLLGTKGHGWLRARPRGRLHARAPAAGAGLRHHKMAARSGSGERARRERPGPRLQAQPQAGDSGLCRGCLSLGLACPLCRRRRCCSGSGSRVPSPGADSGAGPLWQQPLGRRRKQQPGRRRRRRRLGEEAEEESAAAAAGAGPEPEPVFRAPLVLSKAGDVREGLENQLRQYEPEKESLKEDDETVTAEIIQIILAEGEHEKQQMEKKKTIMEQVKRDEELARKWGRDFAPDNMSDSENEEPVKHITTRQWGSAANNKLSSNSSGRFSSMLSIEEENRSWSTPVENNQGRRGTPRIEGRAKPTSVSAGSLVTNNVINILSSSENSRSNSAPNLSSEKRPANDPAPSGPAKRERSASPDSNDSISGEFNHFKPISCSPCTPPKKLPDGRVMKPKIVKSTPRNLGCGFHKPAAATTTYEVNPNLLQKWGQILQERHEEMVASKGTLISEDEGEAAVGRLGAESEVDAMEFASSSSSPGHQKNSLNSAPSQGCHQKVPESWSSHMESIPTQQASVEQGNRSQHSISTSSSDHMGAKKSKGSKSSSSSQGKKRHHKTKHTAELKTKRTKWTVNNVGTTSVSSLDHSQQEDEDRRLAARLQRRLDAERTTVNRQKGSEDGYPLRTKTNFKSK